MCKEGGGRNEGGQGRVVRSIIVNTATYTSFHPERITMSSVYSLRGSCCTYVAAFTDTRVFVGHGHIEVHFVATLRTSVFLITSHAGYSRIVFE